MDKMNNGITDVDNIEDPIEKNYIEEAKNDNWNDKNSQISREEDRKLDQNEKEDNEEKEEADDLQEEGDGAQNEDSGRKESRAGGAADELKSQGFSAVYEAPYGRSEKKTACGGKKKAIFAAVIAAAVAFSLLLGSTIGLGAAILYFEGSIADVQNSGDGGGNNEDGAMSNENQETIKVIRDENSSRVEESVGSGPKTPLSVMGVVEKVSASVVEVTTLENSYYGQYVTSGAGSGVIIGVSDNYSYIVTNYHVVDGSDGITVRLTDKREYNAVYIDGDEDMDIALIKIAETNNIVQATIGSSSTLKVGEGVVAIGNPLGQLGGTVTDGIISALDREINIDGTVMTLLQTNAAINPGNSGGGLFNMYGELIGVVNAKQSASGIEGLGFAIPIDHIYDDIVDVLEDGYIHGRITLGIEVVYLDAYSAYRYFKNAEAGIYVTSSKVDGITSGSRIVSVNGVETATAESFTSAIKEIRIGDQVTFEVKNGKTLSNVTVAAKEYIPTDITNNN